MAETNYDEYEHQCKEQRKKNEKLLAKFRSWLEDSGLSSKTVRNHVGNVETYLDSYLLEYCLDSEDDTMSSVANGCYHLDGYLGDFFIRKCMWSSPSSIKSTAASFKKYYKCILEAGLIENKDYEFPCVTIKKELPHWQESCSDFDSGFSNDWNW